MSKKAFKFTGSLEYRVAILEEKEFFLSGAKGIESEEIPEGSSLEDRIARLERRDKILDKSENALRELEECEKLLECIPEHKLLEDLNKGIGYIYTIKVFIKVENEIRKRYDSPEDLIEALKQKVDLCSKLQWVSKRLEFIKDNYERTGTFYVDDLLAEELDIHTIDIKEWLGVIKYCTDQFNKQDIYELIESKINGFLELESLREECNCVSERLIDMSWDSELTLMSRYLACGISQIISSIAFNSDEGFTEEMKEETINAIAKEYPASLVEEVERLAEIAIRIKQLEKLMRKDNSNE